jgi:hypothetical protein
VLTRETGLGRHPLVENRRAEEMANGEAVSRTHNRDTRRVNNTLNDGRIP